ncbi:MAG: AIR synthase related protein [Candidatus Bathyarchaeota archaeon]|nr:AIR synthase related protein [Candidatus Bathyarchaeota archaeon]
MKKVSRYEELGVNVKKPGIEKFKTVIENLYPNAFCVVQQDPDDPKMGLVTHTDSAGSKPIQAYLHYKETGDPSWFRGIAQDALAMNLNDLICVGAKPITFVDYIAFNTLTMERVEVLNALAEGFGGCVETMREEGLSFMFAGGETADLPDLLRTIDVCVTMFGRAKLNEFITGDRITPGDVIVGLRSGGEVRFEDGVNSGIMSNGHTLARTSLMKPEYLKDYPEISHPARGRYVGRFSYDDTVDELGMTVGEALLSPTRLFAPIAKSVLDKVGDHIHGMVHNTGGGQTKCLRLGKNVGYIKDTLPEPDPIFKLIQSESHVEWKEMYQDFNMGIGYEFIVDPKAVDDVISIGEKYGLGVQVVGRCKPSKDGNSLEIQSLYGSFSYV